MTHFNWSQQVSIAGTVTNGISGDVVPGAQVRITKAPVAFVEALMALVERAVAPHPHLRKSYNHLFQGRQITVDSLKTAQVILDSLSRSCLFQADRLDETVTGGDGHYCFFNLPPGEYGVTAALSTLDHRYGISYQTVKVQATDHPLVFSQLDIEIALMANQAQLPISTIETADHNGFGADMVEPLSASYRALNAATAVR
jgi:hypothetical protein